MNASITYVADNPLVAAFVDLRTKALEDLSEDDACQGYPRLLHEDNAT